jgi:hypothetical protein
MDCRCGSSGRVPVCKHKALSSNPGSKKEYSVHSWVQMRKCQRQLWCLSRKENNTCWLFNLDLLNTSPPHSAILDSWNRSRLFLEQQSCEQLSPTVMPRETTWKQPAGMCWQLMIVIMPAGSGSWLCALGDSPGGKSHLTPAVICPQEQFQATSWPFC